MDNIQQVKNCFLKMVSSILNGETVPAIQKNVDCDLLIKLAYKNSAQAILYFAVQNQNDKAASYISKQLKKSFLTMCMREAAQAETVSKIKSAFNENGIDFLLLKGSVLKSFYPSPEMRFMTDIDILVRENDMEKASRIVEAIGLKKRTYTSKDIGFFAEPFVNVELHRSLFEDDGNCSIYYNDIWRLLHKEESHEYFMSINDLFVYTVAHLAKHYTESGSLLRPCMDLFLTEKKCKNELDFDYIRKQLSKIHLEKFSENIQILINSWFSSDSNAVPVESIENMVLFGTNISNPIEASIAARNGHTKFVAFFSQAFPSLQHMSHFSPWLKYIPIALPLMWTMRLLAVFLLNKPESRESRKVFTNIIHTSNRDITKMRKVFEDAGLI